MWIPISIVTGVTSNVLYSVGASDFDAGQLTAALSQLGQDFGTTDLIFMPDDVQP